MKNYHVNRLKTTGIGWHRDCAGEFRYKYCNNLLSKNEYVFGKIGIYLQENSEEIGGGIDLIPKSHIYIKNKNYFKRKISAIRLKILQIMQKNFPSLYKALKIKAKPGDPVFFDSRVIHRGSPIKDSIVNNFAELDNIHYDLPDKDAKISIYCQYGSSVGVESALYDRGTREEYAGELEMWLKEIELYKKYSPELHSLALDIMHNANLGKLRK
jgi:rhodanese-related sulfurtransferase